MTAVPLPTLSPSRYGKEKYVAKYSATVVLPQPAGPVTIHMCLCCGTGSPFEAVALVEGIELEDCEGMLG